jgi:hypothetical protein
MYLREGWEEAYFGFFFGRSITIRGTTFDLTESGLKKVTDFFDKLLSLLESQQPESESQSSRKVTETTGETNNL